MPDTTASRRRKATSYRWTEADRELIDRLRARYPGPTGQPAAEIDVLRAALVALDLETRAAQKKKS